MGCEYKIKYKRNRRKKRIVLLSFTLAVTLIIIIGISKGFNSIFAREDRIISGRNYIPEEVKNSQDPVTQKLMELSHDSHKIEEILRNIELYPKSLLELASKKEEALDFVYEYPIKKDLYKDKKISIKSDYKSGDYPLFIQWDERWGYHQYGNNYIAINGCGPTALAMVVVGLTGDRGVNPKVVADFAYENGYYVDGVGSSWELMTSGATNFGITGEELPLSEESILSTLRNGYPIIATMGPGDFTTSGHFILLTGVTDDGKIIVNDSDSKIKSEKTWDIDIFMNQTNNLWKFNK